MVKSHNFGLCRKCGEIHSLENARTKNSYKEAVFRENPCVKFRSCADCRRKLKDGEKILKRTIHYHFAGDGGMGRIVGYYCGKCGEEVRK